MRAKSDVAPSLSVQRLQPKRDTLVEILGMRCSCPEMPAPGKQPHRWRIATPARSIHLRVKPRQRSKPKCHHSGALSGSFEPLAHTA